MTSVGETGGSGLGGGHHPPGLSPPRGGLPPTRLSGAPRHRCIIEPGNPTGGQPFRSNEKESGLDSRGSTLSLESRDMENQRRGGERKRVAKVNGSVGGYFTFSRNFVRARFSRDCCFERRDLEDVFLEKNRKRKRNILVKMSITRSNSG